MLIFCGVLECVDAVFAGRAFGEDGLLEGTDSCHGLLYLFCFVAERALLVK